MKINIEQIFISVFALICGFSTRSFLILGNYTGAGIAMAQYLSVYFMWNWNDSIEEKRQSFKSKVNIKAIARYFFECRRGVEFIVFRHAPDNIRSFARCH